MGPGLPHGTSPWASAHGKTIKKNASLSIPSHHLGMRSFVDAIKGFPHAEGAYRAHLEAPTTAMQLISSLARRQGPCPRRASPPGLPGRRAKRIGHCRTLTSRMSVLIRAGATLVLERAATRLLLKAQALCRGARSGWPARDRRRDGAADQRDQPFERVLPIALLRAVALGGDDEDAVARQPPAGQPLRPLAHSFRQRGRMAQVEAKLHRRRHLV